MPQSLVQNYLHIVFSTKRREPFLADREIRQDLFRYLAGICIELQCPAISIGGYVDHIHLLTRHSPIIPLAIFIRELKRPSSVWMKFQHPVFNKFYWQRGYGAFSVGESGVEKVKWYIDNQEAHHQRQSFQDEFRELCRRYQLEIDERYVWD